MTGSTIAMRPETQPTDDAEHVGARPTVEFDWHCCPLRPPPSRAQTEARFDAIGLGLVLLLIGLLVLPPSPARPVGVVVIGVLMLGLNLTRVTTGYRARWLTVVLGVTAVASGVGTAGGLDVNDVALFFAAGGIVTLARAFMKWR